MRARSLVFAAIAAAFIVGAGAPAFADHDDHGRRDVHADRDHHDRDRRGDWERGAYAPPVVVGPPGYYAPPPVAYGPGVTLGITIR